MEGVLRKYDSDCRLVEGVGRDAREKVSSGVEPADSAGAKGSVRPPLMSPVPNQLTLEPFGVGCKRICHQ